MVLCMWVAYLLIGVLDVLEDMHAMAHRKKYEERTMIEQHAHTSVVQQSVVPAV